MAHKSAQEFLLVKAVERHMIFIIRKCASAHDINLCLQNSISRWHPVLQCISVTQHNPCVTKNVMETF